MGKYLRTENGYEERTHWRERKITVLVDNLTFEDYHNGNYPSCNFIPGQVYNVTFNGDLYEGLICYFDEGFNVIATTEDYPFYIYDDGGDNLYIEAEEPYIISIAESTEIYHKIDEKYLPNSIVDTLQTKMDKYNPTGNGSFSMNRKADTVIGINSHAEGFETTASGVSGHAEGDNTTASGDSSHAEGNYTTSGRKSQHVQGEYNIAETGDISTRGIYVHIVGNGTAEDARSNAHTLDWNGNAWYAGDVYVGSTSGTNKDEGSQKLITEKHARELIYNQIYLSDTENGGVYKLEIKNGTLTTSLDTERILQDFTYTISEDGTHAIAGWKETLNGKSSTELVIPEITAIDIEI